MNVLVAVASRQGATMEIAERIAGVLRAAGLETTLERVEAVTAIDGCEAVVLGSAIRIGHWLEPARRFVREHGAELATRPVWLFSSGPIGDPPRPAADPLEIAGFASALGARDHRIFPGKLEMDRLGVAERAIMAAIRAPDGDFRRWPEIDAWAAGIAAELGARVLVPA